MKVVVLMPRWISVKERLPEYKKTVLTTNGHGKVRILELRSKQEANWTWKQDRKWKHYNDITHWMELPEVPKKGEKSALKSAAETYAQLLAEKEGAT